MCCYAKLVYCTYCFFTLCIQNSGLISVRNPKANESEPPKDFFFDAVFDAKVTQKHIYDVCASSVVESVLNGYNGTIFAYGQTGDKRSLRSLGKSMIIYVINNQELGKHIQWKGDQIRQL